jgi:hypothetical protein
VLAEICDWTEEHHPWRLVIAAILSKSAYCDGIWDGPSKAMADSCGISSTGCLAPRAFGR